MLELHVDDQYIELLDIALEGKCETYIQNPTWLSLNDFGVVR